MRESVIDREVFKEFIGYLGKDFSPQQVDAGHLQIETQVNNSLDEISLKLGGVFTYQLLSEGFRKFEDSSKQVLSQLGELKNPNTTIHFVVTYFIDFHLEEQYLIGLTVYEIKKGEELTQFVNLAYGFRKTDVSSFLYKNGFENLGIDTTSCEFNVERLKHALSSFRVEDIERVNQRVRECFISNEADLQRMYVESFTSNWKIRANIDYLLPILQKNGDVDSMVKYQNLKFQVFFEKDDSLKVQEVFAYFEQLGGPNFDEFLLRYYFQYKSDFEKAEEFALKILNYPERKEFAYFFLVSIYFSQDDKRLLPTIQEYLKLRPECKKDTEDGVSYLIECPFNSLRTYSIYEDDI